MVRNPGTVTTSPRSLGRRQVLRDLAHHDLRRHRARRRVLLAAAAAVLLLAAGSSGLRSGGGPLSADVAPHESTPGVAYAIGERSSEAEVAPTGLAVAATAAVDELVVPMPGTTLGVAVADRATGERAIGRTGAEPFYSASLVKIIMAVDVLQRRHAGLPVSPTDLKLLRRALGPSDDEAMNLLWVRFDGPEAVARVARQLGLRETHPPADPSQWGETVVSARDIVTVYRHVLDGMPAADRELITAALATAPATAADGFDQAFGLAPLSGAKSKQGWMCCPDGHIQLHSAGTLGEQQRFVVALLSSIPADRGYDAGRGTVTAAAGTVRATLR
ncbi:MAG: hypothetical protein GEV09_09505 [Pseudonocardiaceae bacterium]|nr:hypothetical protein [Pseudonocardiaceae bacterium]